MTSKTSSFKWAAALAAWVTLSVPSMLQAANTSEGTTQKSSLAPQVQTGTWSREDLQSIIKADDLKVSPFREDGVTYGTPTWVWCVEVDGSLYVRAYNGKASSWYQAAVREKAGRIIAAGKTREVIFQAVDGDINQRIDDAYRAKYRTSPYLQPMIDQRARDATVRIIARAGGA